VSPAGVSQRSQVTPILWSDLEASTRVSATFIAAEKITLHLRIRQLTGEHRTLRERLDAARSASRFLDRRVADLEAQIAEHIIQAN
jgi:hypothetical protein